MIMDEVLERYKLSHEALNKNVALDEFYLRDGIKFKICAESRFPFEFFCFRSPPMVEEMDGFLSMTKNCHALLDVGAYHGVFSLAFTVGGSEKQAIAIEPSPEAYPKLVINLQVNHMDIRAENVALSNTDGALDMSFEWDHAVVKQALKTTDSRAIKVQKITGDALCEQTQFTPDVIKIDVEGHELKVLHGLARVIEQNHPMIFLELHPFHLEKEGDDLADIEKFITDHNYVITSASGGAANVYDFERVVLKRK